MGSRTSVFFPISCQHGFIFGHLYMVKLAIIGANEFQNRLILRANERGIETHVFSWLCGDVGEKSASKFHPIDVTDIDGIFHVIKDNGISAVTSIASDLTNRTVSILRGKLNIPTNSSECLELTTNKNKMREELFKKNCPIPDYQLISDASEIKRELFTLPCIVKPIDRSGSRGITLVNKFKDFDQAVTSALSVSHQKFVLVESYISGKEFSVESFSYEGFHEVLQITEKFTSGAPNFIEHAHLAPARIKNELAKKVKAIINQSLTALKIEYGPSHSEIKITENGSIYVIEIGSRMGGDFIGSDLVKLSTDIDFIDLEIDFALGLEIDLAAVKVRNINRDVAMSFFPFNSTHYEAVKTLPSEFAEVIELKKNNGFTEGVSHSAERFGYAILNVNNIDKTLEILGAKND
jgi:biotin carboxylase